MEVRALDVGLLEEGPPIEELSDRFGAEAAAQRQQQVGARTLQEMVGPDAVEHVNVVRLVAEDEERP